MYVGRRIIKTTSFIRCFHYYADVSPSLIPQNASDINGENSVLLVTCVHDMHFTDM